MKLDATKRTPGKAGVLRSAGKIPGVIYNKEINVPISMELRAFDRVFRSQGTSTLIDLNVDGEVHAVLVRQVQMNKRRREPMHVDFYAITADQPVEVAVPIEIIGVPLGVRDHEGLLDVQRREVRISVLPRHIPDLLELDVTDLNIGDSLHVADAVKGLPEGAEVLDDIELAVVTVVPPRLAEEEEVDDEVTEPELVSDEDVEEDEDESEE